ncbi:hypothetical protein OV079_49575 [Nannocystis pusilla]|uniref:Uncharacterized protein n=1 Tax=Nannocystis pusilla TaxID=889268 RepID=A0A9X3F2L0_9BACT|nr:hypothetical protein [Nannocystis pusilla]MCY1013449.1 hypothetical protein [Nannocystis pusilla]
MAIHTIHSSFGITSVALAFVAILGGCDTPGQSLRGDSDDSQTTQFEAVERVEPNAVIPASPETLALTDGVVSWNVYDEEGVRIVGADADDRALVELQFQVEHDDGGALLGVAVQMNAPDVGTITFDASGQLRESTLGDAQRRLFEALAADIQTVEEGAEVQLRSWSCFGATLALGAACGSAVVTCLTTLGVGCVFGGAGCTAAALDWLCACKNTSC